jgi:chromosome segregation ATPase
MSDADAAHWKARCAELDAELSEFQEMSKQLETEMESNLSKVEAQLAAERKRAERAEAELSSARQSAAAHAAQRSDAGAGLQSQLRTAEAARDQLRVRVNELETLCDTLEQRTRQLDASVAALTAELEREVEARALLAVDADVQLERHQADLQRARDDLRDAQSEIARLTTAVGATAAPPASANVTVSTGGDPLSLAETMLATIRSLRLLVK